MSRQELIESTLNKIKQLPDYKIKEVEDFAGYLLSRIDDDMIRKAAQKLSSDSKTFEFLEDDEDLYTVNDVKEKYK